MCDARLGRPVAVRAGRTARPARSGAAILRVHIKDHDGDPLQFEDCRALLEGTTYMVVHIGTHEVVERIAAEDVDRLYYVETPGDGTE